ncbi:MAG: hypothetical protein MO846_03335, partial [Candidatus Devosia symbiotica]|nr:hypothetical protein [Candidatus Devosia symbiotica]
TLNLSKTIASATTPAASSKSAATAIRLSSAAQTVKDFATVLVDARAKLAKLLTEVNRSTSLESGKPAVGLSGLD